MKNLTSQEFLEKLTPDQKLLVKQLLDTQEEKTLAVRENNYEKAASLRDKERRITEQLKEVYDNLVG